MFQYAFGRAAAEAANATFFLDEMSGFIGDPYGRSVSLNRLPIISGHRSPCFNRLALAAANRQWPYRIVATLQNWGNPLGERFYYERELFNYDPDVFMPSRSTYFIGYWQNPRYFESQAAALRTELAAKVVLNDYARAILKKVRGTESVSVHIRKYDRSDRILFNKERTNHLTLPSAYYEKARRVLEAQVSQPSYFIFSDDPCCDTPFLRDTTYLRVDSCLIGDDLVEHWLMTQCQHHLIANSTFSWWAAWLCGNPHKCVVAPHRWFIDDLPAWQILPPQWQAISGY